MLKWVRYKRCDNCFFSVWLMGLNRPALTCKQKTNFVGISRAVGLEQSCANFYPSADLKLGDRAVRRIPLTRGRFALVDAADYYRLVKLNWYASSNGVTFYACGKVTGKRIKMHRFIMAAPDHLMVDHIDRNGLNNCRSNLRLCTPAQNCCNTASRKGTSKYKGVGKGKNEKKWRAQINSNKKICHIGCFSEEIDAAKAYDKKARQLHGQFACLNFPPPLTPSAVPPAPDSPALERHGAEKKTC
jgi:hypothetical protein